MRIALYGKGGIGKSTIASNISACFARRGMRVLQIGCDPKHDSTMLLSNGEYETVLDVLCQKSLSELSIHDIVHRGKFGIDCIEIGGPKPGVGCAGRGIIKGIDTIERLGILENDYDVIIFDILGDVVCGGFFEPLKGKKVDAMCIVTSGEFNSLFAANNLCAGYLNSGVFQKGVKLRGIIGNLRGLEKEDQIIQNFCNKLNVELISTVPRSSLIEHCTFEGVTVAEKYSDSQIASVYENIVHCLLSTDNKFSFPKPLPLEQLRSLFANNCE